MSDTPRNVLIVDLSHLFWSTALGMRAALGARDAVMKDIRGLAQSYDRIAIACDAKGPSFRAVAFPQYKANRKAERTPERWAALESLKEYCDAAGYHVFVAPEHPDHPGHVFEGDDVVAAIVAWCVQLDVRADILSGDSDLAQLVDDEAGIAFLRRHNGAMTRMGAVAVEEWQGVPPVRIVEVKALAGDGDGYKPFPGIGDTLALRLLRAAPEFTARSVVDAAIAAGITKNADGKTENKVSRVLNDGGVKRVEFGYQMARLEADAPIGADALVMVREVRAQPEIGDDFLPPDDGNGDAIDGEPVTPPSRAEDASPGETRRTGETPASSALTVVRGEDRMLLSPTEARNRYIEVRAFIKKCMVAGTDYGTIPGCGPKPTLLQPGAEKLAELYGYACSFENVKTVELWEKDPPFFYYHYKCKVTRKSDGILVAEYEGSANSREPKWGARWVFEREVPSHFDLERLKARGVKGKKDPTQTYRMFQVPNEEVCAQVNTILKMAQKRAMVSAVRLATRTGGIFEVDEDVPREAFGEARSRQQWDAAA